jgi:Transposase IS200 like
MQPRNSFGVKPARRRYCRVTGLISRVGDGTGTATAGTLFCLQSYSSRILRAKYPIPRRMPSMWTRSVFVSTAGNVSSETIPRYIDEQ